MRLVRAIITYQSKWHCTVSAWMGVTFGGFCHCMKGFEADSPLDRELSLSTSLRNRPHELEVFKIPESVFLIVHQPKHRKEDSINS